MDSDEGEGWGRQSVDRMVGKVEGGWKKEREGGESGGRVGDVEGGWEKFFYLP